MHTFYIFFLTVGLIDICNIYYTYYIYIIIINMKNKIFNNIKKKNSLR